MTAGGPVHIYNRSFYSPIARNYFTSQYTFNLAIAQIERDARTFIWGDVAHTGTPNVEERSIIHKFHN